MTIQPAFLGNSRVVDQIEKKIDVDRLAHGLIFVGPEGVGKRTFAIRVGQMLNCVAAPGTRPCGACDSCRRIARDSDTHVRTITVEEDASEIKIAQIRELRDSLDIAVESGSARVIIIDPARRLTTQASNALLKVLEEPPPRTYFILITTNTIDLLVTIRSRCQVYRFAPLSAGEIRAAGVTDELIIGWARGRVGFALATETGNLVPARDAMLEFLEHALSADDAALAALPAATAELARAKEDYVGKVGILVMLVSDLVALKHSMDDRVVNRDRMERLAGAADRVTLDRIVSVGEAIGYIETLLRSHVHRQALTDALAMAINPRTSEILNDKARQSR